VSDDEWMRTGVAPAVLNPTLENLGSKLKVSAELTTENLSHRPMDTRVGRTRAYLQIAVKRKFLNIYVFWNITSC
jgi:hypothetical protein